MSVHALSYQNARSTALDAEIKAIEKEIAHLEPRAEAERLLTIADPKRRNPWAGATERVSALRQQIKTLQDEAAASELLRVLNQYESHVRGSRHSEIRAQMDLHAAEMQKTDMALVHRWECYYGIHPGLKDFMDGVINKLIKDPDAEIPRHSIGLEDDYIRQVARHYGHDRERRRLGGTLMSHDASKRALELRMPVLEGIEVADKPRESHGS